MKKAREDAITGDVLDEEVELSLAELCRTCELPAERVYEMVEEGIIDPLGRDPDRWRFRWVSVRRARCALRLEHDLGVNLAGAALALELLEELDALRLRMRRYD